MKCRFCSGEADTTCEFTLSEPRINFPAELAVGDLVQSSIDLQFGMIEKLTGPHDDGGMGPYYLATISGTRHTKPQFLNERLPVLVIRHELCGTPVCDVHFVNRGDDKSVCAYHWIIEEVKHEPERMPDALPRPVPKLTPIRTTGNPAPERAKRKTSKPDPPAAGADRNAKAGRDRAHLVR